MFLGRLGVVNGLPGQGSGQVSVLSLSLTFWRSFGVFLGSWKYPWIGLIGCSSFFVPEVFFHFLELLLFSGLSFNPVGIALTGHLFPLQMATLFGIFGLSFWVMASNLIVLRTWILGYTVWRGFLLIGIILTPYLFGWAHVTIRDREKT